ncbi:hypothetical protein PFICI_05960 [Pestalotiopsis fici W106-1]|uniref:Uncharacterized protein n=1 Tax=Pestalotiopsis fici (strain W106-1 / CGMCC3.15140) TaxID=1229662 RepID=W3XDI4_PESFW|nr:uncharacterized protein PFICI_05960 [Pestalotiopsis fici W106-1]ETS84084.1 hypothetical protein PFICI_05960 [Pestalotiopsis fici W106-1]
MDKPSLQPLTRKNLVNHDNAWAADAYKVPCARADTARRQLHQLLWTLGRIGPRGQHILKQLDIYIAGPYSVQCRESADVEPDPNDVQYWEDKLQSYRDQYTPIILLEEAKGRVYSEMMVLRQLGREGARLLALDELYIAGPYEVRCAAERCSEMPLDDVRYWDEKWHHFHTGVEALKSACPRPLSPAALTIDGSLTEAFTSDDDATTEKTVVRRDNKVEAWVHTLQDDAGARPRNGTSHAHQSWTNSSHLLQHQPGNEPANVEPPRPRKRKHQAPEGEDSKSSRELRRSKRLKAHEKLPKTSRQELEDATMSTLGDHGLRRSARLALKPRKRYTG